MDDELLQVSLRRAHELGITADDLWQVVIACVDAEVERLMHDLEAQLRYLIQWNGLKATLALLDEVALRRSEQHR